MTNDDTDPLGGADIGETHTVRESVELHTVDFEPGVYYGSDRFGRASVERIEVTENEYGDETVVVTFEGELTKALPPRWDEYREPLTDAEQQAARRKVWLGRLGNAAAIVVPMLGASVLANHLMQAISGDMTVNGEAVTAPGTGEMAMITGAMLVLAAVVFYAANEVLPPRVVGGRR